MREPRAAIFEETRAQRVVRGEDAWCRHRACI
jgi:hypothetical protein